MTRQLEIELVRNDRFPKLPLSINFSSHGIERSIVKTESDFPSGIFVAPAKEISYQRAALPEHATPPPRRSTSNHIVIRSSYRNRGTPKRFETARTPKCPPYLDSIFGSPLNPYEPYTPVPQSRSPIVGRHDFYLNVISPDPVLSTVTPEGPTFDPPPRGQILPWNWNKGDRLKETGAIIWNIPCPSEKMMTRSAKTKWSLLIVLAVLGVGFSTYLWRANHKNPIFVAIEKDNVAVLRVIYPKPFKVYNEGGSFPLNDALLLRRVDIVKYLLSIGVDPNEPDLLDQKPIGLAVDDRDCLKVVIAAGASVNAVDPLTGFTPLIIESAQLSRYRSNLDLLLEAGADPNLAGKKDGVTALMRACKVGNLQSVKLLLDYGVSLDPVDKKGKSARDYARESKSQPLIELLDKWEREHSRKNVEPKQLEIVLRIRELMGMKWAKSVMLVALCLGVILSIPNSGGWWRSHVVFRAIDNGNLSALKKSYPIAETLYDKRGYSPLTNTLVLQDVEMVAYLLSIGVDPNKQDQIGFYPAHLAALNSDCLKLLIKRGLDLEVKDQSTGYTPLLIASGSREIDDSVTILLDAGAKVNVQDNQDGATPLIRACRAGNVRNVNFLLKAGADITLKDKSGRTAADYAEKAGRKDILEALESRNSAVQK